MKLTLHPLTAAIRRELALMNMQARLDAQQE